MRLSALIQDENSRSYRRGPRYLNVIALATVTGGLCLVILSMLTAGHKFETLFGISFIITGIVFYIGRSKITIYFRRRVIVERASILDFFQQRTYQFDAFSSIAIIKDWHRQAENQKHHYYAVTLQAKDRYRLPLGEYRSFFKARSIAEDVSTKCRLPITDETEGRKYLRSSDILHRSLRDQLVEKNRDIPRPTLAYIQDWVTESESGSVVTILMPPTAYSFRSTIEITVVTTIIFLSSYYFFSRQLMVDQIHSFLVALFGSLIIASLRYIHLVSLRLHPEEIRYRHHIGPLYWGKTLLTNELEELRLLEQNTLLLHGEKTDIYLRGVTVAQSRELSHLIKHWLLHKSQNMKA